MFLVDTHTHIYLPEFEADRQEIYRRAEDRKVGMMLLPAIDSATHDAMLACRSAARLPMIGLHPCSVKGDVEKELLIVEELLAREDFVAIGETGLDFYWDRSFEALQYVAFRRQAAWALERDLPLVIHSRDATDECIGVVEEFKGLRGVFHCFSGTEAQAKRIIENGFYLGIGGVVTFKNAGLDKVVEGIGLGNLVLETDAPYLAPVPYRGKRNEPAYLLDIATKISQLLKLDIAEVGKITTENARCLFNLWPLP